MPLPRGDAFVAFAGSTLDAYPLMLQLRNWVENDPMVMDRGLDINEMKRRMRLMFNDMRLFITDLPAGQKVPDPIDCELLFGGWSWQKSEFLTWRFRYVPSRQLFDFESQGAGIKVGRDHPITFAGTREAVEMARDMIIEKLKTKGRFRSGERYLDMEPFEVLRDIIREQKVDDVGGPPQLIKLYRNATSKAFAVKWALPHQRDLTVLGRPLFKGEKTKLPTVDPDNIIFLSAKTIEKRAKRGREAAKSSD
jgi:hypothetical protein